MKKIYLVLFLISIISIEFNEIMAQVPQSFLYQAEARDSRGKILSEESLSVRVTILQDNITEVYKETHAVQTDINGLFNLRVGEGDVIELGNFSAIEWNNGTYFLNIQIAVGASTRYTDMGTTQLLSVPYALHAETVSNSDDADADPTNELQNLSIAGNQLSISDGNTISLPFSGGSNPPAYTSAEIAELTPSAGESVFNITEKLFLIYNGDVWQPYTPNDNCWPLPTNANAGMNQAITDGIATANLTANTPEAGYGTGKWIILSGEDGSFADPSSPTTIFNGKANEEYNLQWTISTSCDISTDEVLIVFIDYNFEIMDIDGNAYHAIQIGDQVWMAENLRATKFNDGTDISMVTDPFEWSQSFGYLYGLPNVPAYCWYNNDMGTYAQTYGALYNWFAVETGKLCPIGWHVPTRGEWQTLYDFLGYPFGGKLKETGITHWSEPNAGATNQSGFTALPGGFRYVGGSFSRIGEKGYWWSATTWYSYQAWSRALEYDNISFAEGYADKEYGFSVRCIKD